MTNNKVTATKFRYIKLGSGNEMAKHCIESNIVGLGYGEISSELKGDYDKIKEHFNKQGNKKSSDYARQISDFYHLDQEETIWFTFHKGLLYWCKVQKDVIEIPEDPFGKACLNRYRKAINGWSSKSTKGELLRIHDLNGNLTKTIGYRGTICSIEKEMGEYLLCKINGELTEISKEANEVKKSIKKSIEKLFKSLNPKDFELLVDLVFSQSGWKRISMVGGNQANADIIIEQTATAERSFIQVKTSTSGKEFEKYLKIANDLNMAMFYVYHTNKDRKSLGSQLAKNLKEKVHLVGPEALSEKVLDAGLFNWLLKRVA